MARYRDPRIDYSIADAARELKDLVLELSLQRDKFKLQEKLRREDREYTAAISMYQDAKKEAIDAEKQYNRIEDSWRESGLSLSSLNDMFKTDESLKVLKNINEIPAQDWKQRSQHFSDKAFNLKRKADLIGNELFGDIRKAKNILAGGAGYAGGTDKKMWDPQDLGFEAYQKMFPEDKTTDIVKEFFDVNPGLLESSLAKLQKQQLDFMSLREKLGYYNRLGEKATSEQLRMKRGYIQKSFSGQLNSAKHRSGLNDVKDKQWRAAQYRDALDPSDKDMKANIEAMESEALNDAERIGRLYGSLFGKTNLSEQDAMRFYKDYDRVHALAKSTTAVREGVISDPDFMPYWNSIEKAYNTWSVEKDLGKKSAMEETAKILFGFYGDFEEFYQETIKNKADYLISPFKEDGQVTLDDGRLPTEVEPKELLNDDDYFESLL
jgi:hypothetical protein